MKRIYLVSLLFIFNCAGYKLKEKRNPFAQYGIRKIVIPSFYNYSPIGHASTAFTREIIIFLRSFDGLEIVDSVSDSDGVLIGIVSSQDKYKATITNGDQRVATDVAPAAVSEKRRGEFYIPASTNVELKVRFILLKNPSDELINLMQKDISKNIVYSDNVIFNEEMTVSKSFNREIFDGESKSVNASQNRKALQRTVEELALMAKNNFSELILYVF